MTGNLDIGVAVSSTLPARTVCEVAAVAQEAGFSSLWLTDQRFHRDCYVLLGALSQVAPGLRLASAVSDPFSRHPALLAMSAITMAELTGDEFILGLGAGGANLEPMGTPRTQPLDTVETAILALRDLFAGKSVSADTPGFSMDSLSLGFDHDATVRLAVAAHGPRMYELAGRHADIVLLANYVKESGIAWALEHIARGAGMSPNGSPQIYHRLDVCISDDEEAAKSTIVGRVAAYLSSGYYRDSFIDPLDLHDGERSGQTLPNELAGAVAISGDSTGVGTVIAELAERWDWSGLCLRPFPEPRQTPVDALQELATALRVAGLLK